MFALLWQHKHFKLVARLLPVCPIYNLHCWLYDTKITRMFLPSWSKMSIDIVILLLNFVSPVSLWGQDPPQYSHNIMTQCVGSSRLLCSNWSNKIICAGLLFLIARYSSGPDEWSESRGSRTLGVEFPKFKNLLPLLQQCTLVVSQWYLV
jgi:hypothetical protein